MQIQREKKHKNDSGQLDVEDVMLTPKNQANAVFVNTFTPKTVLNRVILEQGTKKHVR